MFKGYRYTVEDKSERHLDYSDSRKLQHIKRATGLIATAAFFQDQTYA